VDTLAAGGARDITVRTLDYVFRQSNELSRRLDARLG
jgi:hypothetical protein